MASSIPVESSRLEKAPNRTEQSRPKMTLANQHLESSIDLPTDESQPLATTLTEKFPTFYIWSIFNLIFLPFGILCCYFSHQVSRFQTQNRCELTRKWSKRTFVINIITTLVMFGVIISTVMLTYDKNQRYLSAHLNQSQVTIGYIQWQPGR